MIYMVYTFWWIPELLNHCIINVLCILEYQRCIFYFQPTRETEREKEREGGERGREEEREREREREREGERGGREGEREREREKLKGECVYSVYALLTEVRGHLHSPPLFP